MTEDDHCPGTAASGPRSEAQLLPGDDPAPAGTLGLRSCLRAWTGRSGATGEDGRTRRRWPWVLFIAAVVAVAVASRINLNYYAVQPGTAQSVQQFITVPADKSHPVTHPVLLTDVEIGRVTALSYLFYKLQSDTDLEPVEAVTGGTPPSQLDAQGNLEMSQAEADAKTAALRRLGYTVPATAAGAVIFGTFPGTPAYPVLHVGDVVTAVDGAATPTAGTTDPHAGPLPLGADGDPLGAQSGNR